MLHPCSSWWGLYVENGLVQPIDTSQLSNWSGVAADLAEQGQFDGEQYFIPWEWGYESILVRTDLVEQVSDSWTDLWMASNAWPDAYAILLDEEVPVQYFEPAEGGWAGCAAMPSPAPPAT